MNRTAPVMNAVIAVNEPMTPVKAWVGDPKSFAWYRLPSRSTASDLAMVISYRPESTSGGDHGLQRDLCAQIQLLVCWRK